ncbi:flippase-like domain-containing protein [candidate division KSB1 bacterium]|nr:flippase-like domain-containing protein [candidate division KSB1 bacterium]
MKNSSMIWKLILGIVISCGFLFLAFRKIDFSQMKNALQNANYYMFIPAIVLMFLGHWLRAIRWHYLIRPLKRIRIGRLFTALLIGYMGNTVLPAHLGEFIRAYIIGKKEDVPMSAAVGTIVVERIIDMFSLFIIMMVTLALYPFPEWMKELVMPMGILTLVMVFFLVLLKKSNTYAEKILQKIISILPERFSQKIQQMVHSFLNGIVGLEKSQDYLIIFGYSLLIWGAYWGFLHIDFYAFHLAGTPQIGAISSLVLLVTTTVAIVIPSSPGYIGTYHLICQETLMMFGISRAMGLSFAIVSHVVNILPVFLVGLVLFWKEGLNLMAIKKVREQSVGA